MLTWTQSDIDAVQNYIISYTRTAGCSDAPSGSQNISGCMRMYTLRDLQESITYNITLTAINTRNRLSATESFTTLTESMLTPIRNIILIFSKYLQILKTILPVQQNECIY